ncbi:MAG: NAD(P)H-dependent oxidoreductase [Alphaproteobacteria bacterium]|nr:MAG: NAD(P)H-dependent oxidoreductase [Alphaproteobacteria bacterium]
MYVVNCSLNPKSKGRRVFDKIQEEYKNFNYVDLEDYPLPHCNGWTQSAFEDKNVKILHDKLIDSKGILLVAPVYNWDINSVAKNFMEMLGTPYEKNGLTGKVFHHKVIGIIAISGSKSSYLAHLGLMNSFMIDFQAFIVPKHALITREDFKEDGSFNMTYVNETVDYFEKMVKALGGVMAKS